MQKINGEKLTLFSLNKYVTDRLDKLEADRDTKNQNALNSRLMHIVDSMSARIDKLEEEVNIIKERHTSSSKKKSFKQKILSIWN